MERNIDVHIRNRRLCILICELSTSLIKKKMVDEDISEALTLKELDCASFKC